MRYYYSIVLYNLYFISFTKAAMVRRDNRSEKELPTRTYRSMTDVEEALAEIR